MASATALPDWLDRIGVFDLETTGIDVRQDRIVTAHVGVLDATGAPVSGRSWLADPGVPIPDTAAAVHGIDTARAQAEGRPAAEVVGEILAALEELFAQGVPVVVYNAPFDLSLLAHEAARHGATAPAAPCPVIDPLIVDKAWDRYRRGKRTLELVAAHYAVPLEDAHDAEADAVAAGRVALALLRAFPEEVPPSARELHECQVGWAQEQAASLTDYLVRVGRMSAGDTVRGGWPRR